MIMTAPKPVPYLNPAFDPTPPFQPPTQALSTPEPYTPPQQPTPPKPPPAQKPKPSQPKPTSQPRPSQPVPASPPMPASQPPSPPAPSPKPSPAPKPPRSPKPAKAGTNPAHDLGRRGEDLVAKYVETRGLIVLCRNWHCREGELDILATDGHMLVVCEVKTRTTDEFGTPADAMSDKKIRRIRAATNRWLREYHIPYVPVRYDLAEVWWPPTGKPHLQYRRDAF